MMGTKMVLSRTRKPARMAVVRWRPSDWRVAATEMHSPSWIPACHSKRVTLTLRSRSKRTMHTLVLAVAYVPH